MSHLWILHGGWVSHIATSSFALSWWDEGIGLDNAWLHVMCTDNHEEVHVTVAAGLVHVFLMSSKIARGGVGAP
jgi:hypothetical protein